MAPLPSIEVTGDIKSANFDAVILVAPSVRNIPFEELKKPLEAYVDVDKSGEKGLFVVPSDLPSKKIIYSCVSMENDWDDVRSYANAAKDGIKKALASGSSKPLLVFNSTKFQEAGIVAVLGALDALYVPLEVREQVPDKQRKVELLGIFGQGDNIAQKID